MQNMTGLPDEADGGPAALIIGSGCNPGRCPHCGTFQRIDEFSMLAPTVECGQCHISTGPASFVEHALSQASLDRPCPGIQMNGNNENWKVETSPTRDWRIVALWLLPVVLTGIVILDTEGWKGNEAIWTFHLIVGVLAALKASFLTWGRYAIRVCKGQATIFRGIGTVGRSRHFRWAQLRTVALRDKFAGKTTKQVIEIVADRKLTFGSMLSDDQRVYLSVLLVAKHRTDATQLSPSQTAELQ